MGPACKATCLLILGMYISFQLVDTFYFNLGDSDQNEQETKEFFGPFIDIEGPIRIDKENEREDEMNSSHESDLADFFPSVPNNTQEPVLNRLQESSLGCNDVREERYRCCRVFDEVVEAWWCPERRPFCCHQGTFCAVCCTPDELRRTEDSLPPVSCQRSRQRAPGVHRQQPAEPPVDDNWFWSGMKAAWLTMLAVFLTSLCCTCLAYKCIKYLVTIVNEEDSDLEEEYLAFHFDNLALVSAEDRQANRQAAARGLLPPKYSDINFIPAQPEAPVAAAVPGEPPPQYTSEPEPELETETQAETEAETRTETPRPPSTQSPPSQI